MGREDQVEEREVLDSIFPDEITGTWPLLRPEQRSTVKCTLVANVWLCSQTSPKPHTRSQ